MRAVVADDEPLARGGLRAMLTETGGVTVVGEAADGQATLDAVRRLKPDVVFLDIQMPALDGITVAELVSRMGGTDVVFVTAYAHHAPRAFDVDAVDYLVKPFDARRLARCLQRLARRKAGAPRGGARAAAESGRRLAIRESGRLRFVRADDVRWAEARGNYVRLHAVGERPLVRGTMAEVLERLGEERFLRISRSTAVALDQVRELQARPGGGYHVVLEDGARLETSRRYGAQVASRLGGHSSLALDR